MDYNSVCFCHRYLQRSLSVHKPFTAMHLRVSVFVFPYCCHNIYFFSTGNVSKSSDLIEPLQRFIETSTLGEFSSRVQMLFTFYKEMCREESTSSGMEGNFHFHSKCSEFLELIILRRKDPLW